MTSFFFKQGSFKKKYKLFRITGLAFILVLILYKNGKSPLPKKLKEINRPFVTLTYQGELGNKLFQTANAISYALEHGYCLLIPKQYLDSKSTKAIFHHLPFKEKPHFTSLFVEKDPYTYQPIPKIKNVELKGFFLSEKYFIKHKDLIKSLFSPPKKIRWSLERKHAAALNNPIKVALHIRTYYKDYLGSGPGLYNQFPAPDLSYYEKAIDLFPKEAVFVVCSDEINWCKKHLSHIPRTFYFVEGQKSIEDFYLLTLCDHMITSNSTFSWWAAYLIANPDKKIIARTPWSIDPTQKEDLILSSWIQISGAQNLPIPNFNEMSQKSR